MVTGNGFVGCDSGGGGAAEMFLGIQLSMHMSGFFSCKNNQIILFRAKSQILVCCAEILMKKLITSIGETLFQTRPDQEEGIIGPVSLLHS